MKKLLLGTAAVAMGLSFAAAQANAQVKLDVGGHAKLYGSWLDQDTATGSEERNMDILRETEVHLSGETTLDNGLTVGAHMEIDVDGSDSDLADTTTGSATDAEEAYAYFSGAWGRVNFGREDGAAYLLQVAAPSADSNSDGIRQWVSGVNTGLFAAGAGADAFGLNELINGGLTSEDIVVGSGAVDSTDILYNAGTINANTRFDYDQAISGYADKLTYMTPVFNGFQAGVSYTPEGGNSADFGNGTDDQAGDYGDIWDVAARYEGQFDEVGVTIGGGWSRASLEADVAAPIFYRSTNTNNTGVTSFETGDTVVATRDDQTAWNVGVDFDWMAFGLGAAYMEDDNGVSGDDLESQTWVVGLDYTTGPFKLGASYYNQTQNFASAELEAERWTGGVVYTYGPGMTFRGSVSFLDLEENVGVASSDADATTILLGTQINF